MDEVTLDKKKLHHNFLIGLVFVLYLHHLKTIAMRSFLNNVFYLLESLFTYPLFLLANGPMYNKNFHDSLTDEDNLILDEAIRKNKENNTVEPFDVKLSGKKTIKIVLK